MQIFSSLWFKVAHSRCWRVLFFLNSFMINFRNLFEIDVQRWRKAVRSISLFYLLCPYINNSFCNIKDIVRQFSILVINYCNRPLCLQFRKPISLKDQFAQIEGEISFARRSIHWRPTLCGQRRTRTVLDQLLFLYAGNRNGISRTRAFDCVRYY